MSYFKSCQRYPKIDTNTLTRLLQRKKRAIFGLQMHVWVQFYFYVKIHGDEFLYGSTHKVGPL